MTRSDDAALLFGRLLLAALLLPGGIEKLLGFSKFAASLSAKGLPYAKVLAGIDIRIEVLGPIALIVGLWPRWVALALLAVTLLTNWATYRTGLFGSAFRAPQHQPHLFKSLAIMAGLALYFASGPGAWSRTGLRRE